MSRKRVVSRTITTTNAECMVCNTSTATVETKNFVVSLKLNVDDALKEVKKMYETETEKIVAVQNVTHIEQLYVMSELDFLKYAKPVNADDVDTDDEVLEEKAEKPKRKKK